MERYVNRDWFWLIDEQHGVVGRSQVRKNGITEAELEHRLKSGRWKRLHWLTEALTDADEGIHFPLERRYARDVERAHGLPKARRQARRAFGGKVHYRDNWYPGHRVCAELDGAAYHPPEQTRKDKRRDNVNLASDDIRTFRFDFVDVTERACQSAAMVAAALRRNGWPGRPHPCQRPGCGIRGTG